MDFIQSVGFSASSKLVFYLPTIHTQLLKILLFLKKVLGVLEWNSGPVCKANVLLSEPLLYLLWVFLLVLEFCIPSPGSTGKGD